MFLQCLIPGFNLSFLSGDGRILPIISIDHGNKNLLSSCVIDFAAPLHLIKVEIRRIIGIIIISLQVYVQLPIVRKLENTPIPQ